MSKFNLLTVKEIRKETPNAVSIVFDIPATLKDDYKFTAGQYLNIKYNIQDTEIRRAYSICSTPNSGELRIAVKKVENGIFSTYANEILRVGDKLEVEIPEGRFTLVPNANLSNNYAAFVAGSGITPVIAIIKTVLEQEANSTFTLIYGNKSAEETIFHKELHLLQEKYNDRLFIHFIYSRTKEENCLFGRIDKAAINFVINDIRSEKDFSKFFLCGPEQMINLISSTLQERGVAKENIAFEIFATKIDNTTDIPFDESNDNATVKVTTLVDDDEESFEMPKNEILLNGVLKAGIDAPYSCQGGICSSCMCRIIKGSAIMQKNSILSEDEIAEGLILSCQALVTSDEIYVDYDDI